MIDANKLADMIEDATRKIEVCVPSRDYYARGNDWERDEIRYIDADRLVELLRDAVQEPENGISE
jgi:hypothetical protein